MTQENLEFDQICMILKHMLIQPDTNDNSESFLDHFLTYENQSYVNVLVDKFDTSPHLANVQWIISDIIKYIYVQNNIGNLPSSLEIVHID